MSDPISSPISETAAALVPVLQTVAGRGETITYAELADRSGIAPPHRIHKTAEALEELIRSDHAAGRPLLAAVAISAKRDGMPGPGFFQLLSELGRYFGPDRGPQAALVHRLELDRLYEAATRG